MIRDIEYGSDDDEDTGPALSLSAETMAALRGFAIESGIPVLGGDAEIEENEFNIVDLVRDHFEEKDREEKFLVEYKTEDGSRALSFEVKGVKRRLGQTLNSTGLTIWRAAEHLCEFIFHHPDRFRGKSVCELGCGLGMVSILLDLMRVGACVVATDGDDDTMDLLRDNIALTDCSAVAQKLYWGRDADLELFATLYPEKFDTLLAADVVYEESQITPLLLTAKAIMSENSNAEFILAFARRNVPMDLVLTQAENNGFQWEVLDRGEGGLEPIYRLTRRI